MKKICNLLNLFHCWQKMKMTTIIFAVVTSRYISKYVVTLWIESSIKMLEFHSIWILKPYRWMCFDLEICNPQNVAPLLQEMFTWFCTNTNYCTCHVGWCLAPWFSLGWSLMAKFCKLLFLYHKRCVLIQVRNDENVQIEITLNCKNWI